MLSIKINSVEFYDETSEEFTKTEEVILQLEHSLVSLSKWESSFEKPFLSEDPKTTKETIDYIKAMTLTEDISDDVYLRLNDDNIRKISNYIELKMTATWFNEPKINPGGSFRKEVITSEIIYYWMISLNIPFECQHWHLNKLLTLIKVCNQKNAPEKKMGKQELIARNRELNEARRMQHNTTG